MVDASRAVLEDPQNGHHLPIDSSDPNATLWFRGLYLKPEGKRETPGRRGWTLREAAG